MGKIVFITGTDTNVGKTFVTTLLVRGLRSRGANVSVFKPIETGVFFEPGKGEYWSDAEALAAAVGETAEEVVPYRLRIPAAPLLSSRLENVTIDAQRIFKLANAKAERCDFLFVEGAGGLLVPYSDSLWGSDVIVQLNAVVVVVVGSKLGALNHALLTFDWLQQRGIPLMGYVLTEPSDLNQSLFPEAVSANRDVLSELSERLGIEELGYLPHFKSLKHEELLGEQSVKELIVTVENRLR